MEKNVRNWWQSQSVHSHKQICKVKFYIVNFKSVIITCIHGTKQYLYEIN